MRAAGRGLRRGRVADLAVARATVAEGIAIAAPPRGAQVVAAVRRERRARSSSSMTRRCSRRAGGWPPAGWFVEPTAAAAVAAWRAVADDLDGTTVIPLCGAGLKSP